MNPVISLTIVALACVFSATNAFHTGITIPTTSGTLMGSTITLDNGERVHQFLGVPYAQAPLGKLRFEKPSPLANATSALVMAQDFKPTCIQMRHFSQAISPLLDVDELHNTDEDCLYLNVYVPADATEESKLPIMVWLPGEGFDFADARQFNGAYLAAMGKVIMITVQYRVGIFGFLKDNAGLWDQVQALKWVNENAASFGGDSERVTLFGRFSGSMSISVLLASPVVIESKVPLFSRAILMSGIAVGQWVFDYEAETRVSRLLNAAGIADSESLKTMDTQQVLALGGYGWKPIIDGKLIVDEPLAAIRDGKFPKYVHDIMLGSNKFEGNLCLLKHMVVDKTFYDKLVTNNISTEEYTRAVREDLAMFYGPKNVKNDLKNIVKDRNNYVEFCAELLINSHMRKYQALLKRLVYNSQFALENVFDYKLDYKPAFSIAPAFMNSSIHGDDVILAFGLAFKNSPLISREDRSVSQMMVEMFSHFADHGTPYSSADESFEIRRPASLRRVPFFFNIEQTNLILVSLVGLVAVAIYALSCVYFKWSHSQSNDMGKRVLIEQI